MAANQIGAPGIYRSNRAHFPYMKAKENFLALLFLILRITFGIYAAISCITNDGRTVIITTQNSRVHIYFEVSCMGANLLRRSTGINYFISHILEKKTCCCSIITVGKTIECPFGQTKTPRCKLWGFYLLTIGVGPLLPRLAGLLLLSIQPFAT